MAMRTINVLALLILLAARPAFALPDEVKAQFEVGAGPAAVVFSDDDRVAIAVNTDDGTLSVADSANWLAGATTATTCDTPRAAAFEAVSASFVIACEQGTVARHTVNTETFPAGLDALSEIQLTEAAELVDLAVTDNVAFVLSADGQLFKVDLSTSSEVTDSYFPIALGEAAVAIAGTTDGSTLVVALAAGDLVELTLDDESYAVDTIASGEADLADVTGNDPFYALSSDGAVFRFVAGDVVMEGLAGLNEGDALCLLDDDGSPVLGVLGGGLLTYLDVDSGDEIDNVAVIATANDAAASTDGYVVISDPGADLMQVITDNPWVRIETFSPDPADTEADVIMSVTSDVDGDLSLLLGGDIDGSGSDLAPDVTALVAEETVDITFSGSALADGDNLVFLFVDDGNSSGRNAALITAETTTEGEVVAPSAFAASAGNGLVSLSWYEVEDDGFTVDYYLIYFSNEDFEPLDGDPGFCSEEDEELCSGIIEYVVDASGASDGTRSDEDTQDDDDDDTTGDDDSADDDDDTADDDTGDDDTTTFDGTYSVTIDPLTNGTTYYFAVAAVTTEAEIGAFTEVVSATPQVTGGAAWLAGDTGGYGCGGCSTTGGSKRGMALLGLLGLVALVRRVTR